MIAASLLSLSVLGNAIGAEKKHDPEKENILNSGMDWKEENGLLGSLREGEMHYLLGDSEDKDVWVRKNAKKKGGDAVTTNTHSRHENKFGSTLDQPDTYEKTPPPDTAGNPTKVEFDTSTNADNSFDVALFNIIDQNFLDGSVKDEEYSQFFVLTRSGYEYQGSPAMLESIFLALRLQRGSLGEDIDQMNKDIVDKDLVDQLLKTIFPPDTRTKVTNTQEFPYSAIGRVGSGCTGTFIGPRHILTAGHCVYNTIFKKWQKNLNFQRGKNCDPNKGTYHSWKYAITTVGWKLFGWAAYDYALIVVDEPSPVWMDIGWKKPMPQFTVNINGYPGDKSGMCMWKSSCKIMWQSNKRLGYTCDTYNGMSGSSVYAEVDGSQKVVYCVHAYGRRFSGYNKCTRITESRFELLKYWIDTY